MGVVQQLKNPPFIVENFESDSGEELKQDLAILEKVKKMLLEVFNAAFTHGLSSSKQLVYHRPYQR